MSADAVGLVMVVAGFFLFALVWPTVRLWRRERVMGLTLHRTRDPFERVVGAGMAAFLTAVPLWTGLYAALGPSALGVWPRSEGLRVAGWAVCGAGLLLTLVAQAQMGASWRIGIDERPTGLVRHGLFRVVRNPIFTGMLLTLSGLVLVSPSAWTLMAWLHALLLISLQARLEERHLLALHGEAYRAYAARVGRFLPGVGRLSASQ
jgi:protein-S-isoprenylcysteine O-methyltransferase Ste14